MAKRTASHFSKDAPIQFLSGNEESDVRRRAQEIVSELVPDRENEFALDTIDGNADNADQAVERIHQTIEALLTLPFFGGEKVVWLKNASFLADSVTGRSQSVADGLEKLSALLEKGIPDGVRLVISAPLADKRRSFYKQLVRLASVTLCDKPDFGWNATEEDIIQFVASRAKARELRVEETALEVLAARIGSETRQLENELDKLQTAIGLERSITEQDIRQLVPETRQGGIFDLSTAIQTRDLPFALAKLDQLLRQGENAVGILLAAIVPTVRNLLLAKDLMDRYGLRPPGQPQHFVAALKRLPETESAHLPRKKDGGVNAYGLGVAARYAGRYELQELRDGFLACAQANRDLVSTSLATRVVLTRLLLRLLGRPARRRS